MFPHQYLLLEQGILGRNEHLSSAPLKQDTATLTLQEKVNLSVMGLCCFLKAQHQFISQLLNWYE